MLENDPGAFGILETKWPEIWNRIICTHGWKRRQKLCSFKGHGRWNTKAYHKWKRTQAYPGCPKRFMPHWAGLRTKVMSNPKKLKNPPISAVGPGSITGSLHQDLKDWSLSRKSTERCGMGCRIWKKSSADEKPETLVIQIHTLLPECLHRWAHAGDHHGRYGGPLCLQ